ncbi:hypothetical protein [Brevibacillus sp. SYSU BS000544]|uniref:hypothetical protein n=1 Tax=Brevibacillus sp. SYSU BS000544 TaxID=3416443 RepID=UPI003CE48BA6
MLNMWNNFDAPSDKTLLEYDELRYFITGYFTQGIEWSELEIVAKDFLDREPADRVAELQRNLCSLQALLDNYNQERWNEIEQFICEPSMRRLHFKDGQEFIDKVSRGLHR